MRHFNVTVHLCLELEVDLCIVITNSLILTPPLEEHVFRATDRNLEFAVCYHAIGISLVISCTLDGELVHAVGRDHVVVRFVHMGGVCLLR